jgi:hypothetical protein
VSDLHEIQVMRARCARLLDAQDWPAWGLCFTADAVFEAPEADLRIEGREAIVAAVGAGMAGTRSVHLLHAPELELTGPDAATGIWTMQDVLVRGGETHHGYGRYVEEYAREDGTWRISRFRLERLLG